MFNVIGNSVAALFIGLLLALLGTILMLWLLRTWHKDMDFGVWTLLGAVVLFVSLAFHMVMLCGAWNVRSDVDSMEIIVNNTMEQLQQVVDIDEISTSESQQLLDMLAEQYPMLSSFIDLADFRGQSPQDIAHVMADEMRSYLNWYMVRRAAWSLFFLILTTVGVIVIHGMTEGKGQRQSISRTSRSGASHSSYKPHRSSDDF